MKRRHSICRWTFNAGKGGFLPADARPAWTAENLPTEKVVDLIAKEIQPRMPDEVALGFELHYDNEINEANAGAVAEAMTKHGLPLAMITPGAHGKFAYGGIASLDPKELKRARTMGEKTVDLAYGAMRGTWDDECPPTLVLWNGSWGYDLATIGVREMRETLKTSLGDLVEYETAKGGLMPICIEPKPNEGHPAMLAPTVASAILLWREIAEERNLDRKRLGVNKEIGHSEMIGLDAVYDTLEEIANQTLHHTHLNSQGYNDGQTMGGPGKFDIDFGTRVNGFNITLARLFQDAGYDRWYGHDMQPRPYDNEAQAIDRVVRSILSWEACALAAEGLEVSALLADLRNRDTAKVEDRMRAAVTEAQEAFDSMLD